MRIAATICGVLAGVAVAAVVVISPAAARPKCGDEPCPRKFEQQRREVRQPRQEREPQIRPLRQRQQRQYQQDPAYRPPVEQQWRQPRTQPITDPSDPYSRQQRTRNDGQRFETQQQSPSDRQQFRTREELRRERLQPTSDSAEDILRRRFGGKVPEGLIEAPQKQSRPYSRPEQEPNGRRGSFVRSPHTAPLPTNDVTSARPVNNRTISGGPIPSDTTVQRGLTQDERQQLLQRYSPEQIRALKKSGEWKEIKRSIVNSRTGTATTTQDATTSASATSSTSNEATTTTAATEVNANATSQTNEVNAIAPNPPLDAKTDDSTIDVSASHTRSMDTSAPTPIDPKPTQQQDSSQSTASAPMSVPVLSCDPNWQAPSNDPAGQMRAEALRTNSVVSGCPFTFVKNYAGDEVITVSVYQHGQLIETTSPKNASLAYGYDSNAQSTYSAAGSNAATNQLTTTESRADTSAMPTTTDGLPAVTTSYVPSANPPAQNTTAGMLPACPGLAVDTTGLPSCTNGRYVFAPTANNTVQISESGQLVAAGVPVDVAVSKYGYRSGQAEPSPSVQQTQSPPEPVYTFKEITDGNVEIYKDGVRISTGTPQYAAQFGYHGLGSDAPTSNYNQPVQPPTQTQAAANPPPQSSNPGNSQTFYIQSGTGAQLTAEQIRTGTFPSGTYFIESGTGRQFTQADFMPEPQPSSNSNPLASYLPQDTIPFPSTTIGGQSTPATCFPPQCIVPSAPELLSAVDKAIPIATACLKSAGKCLVSTLDVSSRVAIEKVLELAKIEPPLSSQSRTYQFVVNGVSLAITVAGVGALIVAPQFVVPIAIAGDTFYITELLARPWPT